MLQNVPNYMAKSAITDSASLLAQVTCACRKEPLCGDIKIVLVISKVKEVPQGELSPPLSPIKGGTLDGN